MLAIAYFPGVSNMGLSWNIFAIVLTQPYFYLSWIYASIVGIVPNIIRLCVRRQIYPSYYHIVQEMYCGKKDEKYGKKRDVVYEGTDEAREYFSTISRPLPFNKQKEEEYVPYNSFNCNRKQSVNMISVDFGDCTNDSTVESTKNTPRLTSFLRKEIELDDNTNGSTNSSIIEEDQGRSKYMNPVEGDKN